MRVKLLRDCDGPNPHFDRAKPAVRGLNWPYLDRTAGTVVNDRDAYLLCRGPEPLAEPYDDEAKAVHAAYLAQLNAEAPTLFEVSHEEQ
jgi:hypothetical protein